MYLVWGMASECSSDWFLIIETSPEVKGKGTRMNFSFKYCQIPIDRTHYTFLIMTWMLFRFRT